jgi:ankyrin repeat protein
VCRKFHQVIAAASESEWLWFPLCQQVFGCRLPLLGASGCQSSDWRQHFIGLCQYQAYQPSHVTHHCKQHRHQQSCDTDHNNNSSSSINSFTSTARSSSTHDNTHQPLLYIDLNHFVTNPHRHSNTTTTINTDTDDSNNDTQCLLQISNKALPALLQQLQYPPPVSIFTPSLLKRIESMCIALVDHHSVSLLEIESKLDVQSIAHIVARYNYAALLVHLLQRLPTRNKALFNDLLNQFDCNGNTPLHVAVRYRSFECCQTLLRARASIDALNHYGSTALMVAAQHLNNADVELWTVLIDRDAELRRAIEWVDERVPSRLDRPNRAHLAAKTIDTNHYASFMSFSSPMLDSKPLECLGIDEIATLAPRSVPLAIADIYDPSRDYDNDSSSSSNGNKYSNCTHATGTRNADGRVQTIAHALCRRVDNVDQLLTIALQVDATNTNDQDASLLRKRGVISAIEFDWEPLHLACFHGNYNTVEALVREADRINQLRAVLHARIATGETPLLLSIRGGNARVFKLLIESGANLADTDADGNSVLHHGMQRNRLSSVGWILGSI